MTSTDDADGDPPEAVPVGSHRVGAGGWLVRTVGLVAVAAGVVLGVLGWSALGDAADDEDAVASIEAGREEVAAQLAAEERRRERRLDRITVSQAAVRELQNAVNALSMAHSGFFDDADGPLFENAASRWNAGDHDGAVAILDAEVAPVLATLRDRLGQLQVAETAVVVGTRDLPEPPP